MLRLARTLVATALFAVALATPLVAVAAPASWQTIDVTLHSEESGGVLLVSGQLPSSTPLPAQAELAVPAGTQLQWIGEILGGPPASDPALTYEKSTVDSADVYRFTLTKSRIAQAEVVDPGFLASNGTDYDASLKWTPTQPVAEVTLRVRIPSSAQVVGTSEGASLTPGEAGYAYYGKTVKDVKAGQPLDLAFAYKVVVAPSSAGSPAGQGSDSTAVAIISALALALLVLAGVAVRRKMSARVPHAAPPVRKGATAQVAKASGKASAGAKSGGVRRDATTLGKADTSIPTPAAGIDGRKKKNLATVVVVGLMVIFVVVVAQAATKPKVVGDTITQTFQAGEPEATADIAVAAPGGVDPGDTADTLFAALKPVAGLNVATYNIKTGRLNVGFCSSEASEEKVRAALQPTGLLAGTN